jgi:hypothetical protein
LSAKAERSDVRKGMELGADDYLTKPFEESELLNAIEGRLKRSELFRKGFDRSADGLSNFIESARGLGALKDITSERKLRHVARKEMIFHEGDELRSVYFINSGKVRTFKMNNDGKEFVTGLHTARRLPGLHERAGRRTCQRKCRDPGGLRAGQYSAGRTPCPPVQGPRCEHPLHQDA